MDMFALVTIKPASVLTLLLIRLYVGFFSVAVISDTLCSYHACLEQFKVKNSAVLTCFVQFYSGEQTELQ